jgi:hydrogenase maturation protease
VGEVAVVGVGNPERGDDAAGPAVVARLEGRLPTGARTVVCSGADPGTLIDAWQGAVAAVLIDAVVSGAEPGRVTVFDVTESPLPPDVRPASTHALGAAAAIELARALDRLPRTLLVVGIEAQSFDAGAPLSKGVAAAIDEAAGTVLTTIARYAGGSEEDD